MTRSQARRDREARSHSRFQHVHARVDQIAAVTKRPQDVIGTHFPGRRTRCGCSKSRGKKNQGRARDDEARQGDQKVPVVSGVCDGFIGNA
jgi:3-hydroxyacyl-CoA dehydrogenase